MGKRYSVVFLSEDISLLKKTEDQLSQEVDYYPAQFSAEAESKALNHNADLIAIDSRIAGNRGYDICEEFKTQKETSHIAIMLLGHEKGVGEKIRALAKGCDQAIYYPDCKDNVLEKVAKTIQYHEKQQRVRVQQINGDAIHAFNYNQFYDACFNCESGDDLADLFISGAQQLKIECAIQIRMKDKTVNVELSGLPNDIDSLLLANLKPNTETIPLGTSIVINRPKVGAIGKNMPITSYKHYDFIQETLEAMLDTINTQVENLDFEPDETANVNPAKDLVQVAGIVYSFFSNFQLNEKPELKTGELLALVTKSLSKSPFTTEVQHKIREHVKIYITKTIDNCKNDCVYGDNELGNLMEMLRAAIKSD